MKMMSVDYGDSRTGIAFCDVKETLAFPYTVIKESYLPKLIAKIAEIVQKELPEKIIIGLPRNMDGTYGYRCDACRLLGTQLAEAVSVPIDFQDERLTTVMAHHVLSANHVKGKKRKDHVDAVSAVMILQSYINKNNR